MSAETKIGALLGTLETAIEAVEGGEKNAEACCTLVGTSMKDTGIRPKMVSMSQSGERVYLLNVRQARRLRERALEALELIAHEAEEEK